MKRPRKAGRFYDADILTDIYRSIQSVIGRLTSEQEDLRETLRYVLDALDPEVRLKRYSEYLARQKSFPPDGKR